MALTLQTAREKLSKIIELGISSTDSRSIDRINEAQRRIHSQGIYLGTLQSFAVKVDALTNTFEKPALLETVARVSRFSGTALTSVQAYRFLSNGADVFVSDPSSLLPIAYVSGSPSTFKLLDRSLNTTMVEVVGKAALVEASANSDLLLIDDLDALKMMLLALYREENNQLEQAKAFNDLAIKYLRDKTDASLNVAQKLQHQSSNESSPYGTLGYIRGRLVREMPDLSRINDSELATLINSSQEAAVAHFNFLARQDPDASSRLEFRELFLDGASLAVPSYEVNRLLVLSSQTKKIEESSALKKSAFELIERDFNEQIISRRKNTYNGELFSAPSGSLSQVSARMALDNSELLQKPIQHIRRAVAQAEELIINSGRWNGTIDLLELQTMGGEGEYPLPDYVDAILLAGFADKPVSIYDRDYDFHENGPGWTRPETGASGVSLAIDRGYTTVVQEITSPNSTITLTTDRNARSFSILPYPLISPITDVLSNAYNRQSFKILANQNIDLSLGGGIPNFSSSFKLSGPSSLSLDSKTGRLTGKIAAEIVSGVSGTVASLSWPLNPEYKDYTITVKTGSTTLLKTTQSLTFLEIGSLAFGNSYSVTIVGNLSDTKIEPVLLYSASWIQDSAAPNIVSNYLIGIKATAAKGRRMKVYLRNISSGSLIRFIYKLKPKSYVNPREAMIIDHFSALREVTFGVLSGDQEQLTSRMAMAQNLLNQQLKEKRGGRIIRPTIQLDAWAMGAIDASL
jgi:hypothetical protein